MPKYSRNTSAKKLQRFIRKRRSSRAQAVQLLKTNKRVDRLLLRHKTAKQQYGLQHETSSSALTGLSVWQINPAGTVGADGSPVWTNCFSDSTVCVNAPRARLGRVYCHLAVTCFTEVSKIQFKIFLVKLNPKNAEFMVNKFGNALTGIPVGKFYTRGAAGSFNYSATNEASGVMLNPNYFTTLRQWGFALTGRMATVGSPQSTNAYSSFKNISFSFPTNYVIGKNTGTWLSSSADENTLPIHKHYLLFFCDNSILDAESPQMDLFCQCTATALI